MASTVLADALHLNYGDEGVLRVVYQESTVLQSWVLIWGNYQIFFFFRFKNVSGFAFYNEIFCSFSANQFSRKTRKIKIFGKAGDEIMFWLLILLFSCVRHHLKEFAQWLQRE